MKLLSAALLPVAGQARTVRRNIGLLCQYSACSPVCTCVLFANASVCMLWFANVKGVPIRTGIQNNTY